MGGICGTRRVQRRFFVATLVVLLTGLFASEPALAQLPLGSSPTAAAPTGGSLVGTATQVVPTGQVAEQVAPILGEAAKPIAAVTQPVAQATTPVAQAAAPVTAPAAKVVAPVAQAAAPVTQAAAPVVAQVAMPVTKAAEPVLEQTAPVLESVQPLVDAAAPVLAAAQPLVEPLASPVVDAAAPLMDATAPAIETTAPLLDATTPALRASASTQHDATPEPGAASTGTPTSSEGVVLEPVPSGPDIPALLTSPPADTRAAAPPGRLEVPGQSLRDSAWAAGTRGPSDRWQTTFTAHRDGRATHTARAGAPRTPSPTGPGGPLGFLAAVSAAFASSGALIFFAALAAIILVAAPGLGRRLRPAMAPWPLPIPLPSLERPG
jgi:hypothetical protein